MTYTLTTEAAVRAAFWRENPRARCRLVNGAHGRPVRASQNLQPTDTRVAFVEWLDMAERDGRVSTALAQRATLA